MWKLHRLFAKGIMVACMTYLPSSYAGWIGLNVTGSLAPGTQPNTNITQPFSSPATVGGGVEFTGQFTSVFDFNWTVKADVGSDKITITFSDLTNPLANLFSGDTLVRLAIGGLPNPSGIGLLSYTCAHPIAFVCAVNTNTAFSTLSSTATDFQVAFSALRTGDIYVFGYANPVPEPTSMALTAIAMLMGASFCHRRRQIGRQ